MPNVTAVNVAVGEMLEQKAYDGVVGGTGRTVLGICQETWSKEYLQEVLVR